MDLFKRFILSMPLKFLFEQLGKLTLESVFLKICLFMKTKNGKAILGVHLSLSTPRKMEVAEIETIEFAI